LYKFANKKLTNIKAIKAHIPQAFNSFLQGQRLAFAARQFFWGVKRIREHSISFIKMLSRKNFTIY
jgi:hypothetical protein